MDLELAAKPDVADIERVPLEYRPTTAPLSDACEAFDVVMPLAAWEAIHEHARQRLDVEVGGVLLGRLVASDDGKPYLVIEAGVPALAAESRETNITFTAEAWTHIHEIIDRDHPGASIVGWYHTHPSFGIFLSEMDVFIQRHFFDLPHQVAIVIDPVAQTHGCFIWRGGVPTLSPLTLEGVKPRTPPPPAAPSNEKSIAAAPPVEPARIVLALAREWRPRHSLARRLRAIVYPLSHLDRSQWLALLALLMLAIILFGALVMVATGVSPAALYARVMTVVHQLQGSPTR